MIFGLIPAGGHSRRMGRPKLSLPLGNATVLEHVVSALRTSGIANIVVVIGPHVAELVPLAENAGGFAYLLREPTPDMRATVQHGLRWLDARFHPSAEDGFLLIPADHPAIDREVIRTLATRHWQASIRIPTFQNRRGHPALISWRHATDILGLGPDAGINAYLRQHAAETEEVAVSSPAILWDLDLPEDYARLRALWNAPSV